MAARQLDPTTMDSRSFAQLVKETPPDDLREVLRGDQGRGILDEMVARMPEVFRSDRAGSLGAVIHWRIQGRADHGTDVYQVVIADGRCEPSASADREPALTLTLDAVDFLRMVTGNAHPVMLSMKGKLKTSGDLGLTAKFPSLFDIPKA
ncbi:SCP2 sterol-binding domain-containing protein [Plantactinospora sp. GCM10030261]|uniref:SCP2 sterol-binding domain-containing protein n=1 Tax=Plantactinospora sp. GCM10030261 TaxID=3273420 RepID=UPI00360A5233